MTNPVNTWPEHWVIDAVLALIAPVKMHEVRGDTRRPDVCRARETISGVMHSLTPASWPEIAEMMGRRHHSFTIGAYRRFMARPDHRWVLEQVRAKLIRRARREHRREAA